MSFIKIQKTTVKESWKIRGILLGMIVFGLVITKYYPFNLIRHYFPDLFTYESSCVFLNVFGIPCPFCGMSHALHSMLIFNFAQSFYHNPSSVIFFPFLAMICLAIFILSIFNYKISVSFNKTTLIASAIIFFTIWLLNIFWGHP